MTGTAEPLAPFGLCVVLPPGTTWDMLDLDELVQLLDTHRVVLLRGLAPLPPEALAAASRKLGPLQPWRFGSVHELKYDAEAENYLYTDHAVPLHWDGAFAERAPRWLVFRCVSAPPPGSGGETVFVDTTRVLANATPAQAQAWAADVRYTTEKVAHYGGSFTARVIQPHPRTGAPVLRYAEPVDDLNPVTVEVLGVSPERAATLQASLRDALYAPEAQLVHAWLPGDVLLADNHTLLHGRRAYTSPGMRHLLRVNVMDPERRWWCGLRDSWRIRRPEFLRAEIPIFAIPAVLSAPNLGALGSWTTVEGALLFLLLFQSGDLVNCLLDRDVDLHRKTHLAEAVHALGTRAIVAQIAVTATLSLALGVHLAVTLGRWWMVAAAVLGTALGAGYTLPPLRLKSRGLLQLGAYVSLLFIGPMAMVAGLYGEPSPWIIAFAAAFGLTQSGTLLVNNAEDLDEDEREGIRTASVVLGATRAVKVARGLVVTGALVTAALLGWGGSAGFALPLVTAGFTVAWLTRLVHAQRGLDEPAAREAIRKQGKHVPGHLERHAWVTLLAAALGRAG